MCDLPRIQQALIEFRAYEEAKHQQWVELRRLNPNGFSMSEAVWQREHDRDWVLCRDSTSRVSEAPQHPFNERGLTEVGSATSLHENWLADIGEKPEFSAPRNRERLDEYLCRLASEIAGDESPSQYKERNLRSFLSYLRNALPSNEIAFLEHIFPEEMEIRGYQEPILAPTHDEEEIKEVPRSMILRRVHCTGHPIPIESAACILRILADRAFQGRPDSQRTSAIALGLCWVCLTAAKMKLTVRIKDLLGLSASSLTADSPTTPPAIIVPTTFGERTVPISKTLWRFLNALQNSGKLFDRTEKSLYRELARAIKALPEGLIQGRIGFQTFLAFPHGFGNHRYQPKNDSSRRRKKMSVAL